MLQEATDRIMAAITALVAELRDELPASASTRGRPGCRRPARPARAPTTP